MAIHFLILLSRFSQEVGNFMYTATNNYNEGQFVYFLPYTLFHLGSFLFHKLTEYWFLFNTQNLPRPLQLEAMTKYTVLLHEEQSWEYELDSPSPFRTPISPKQNMDGKDHDNCVDFKLIETT